MAFVVMIKKRSRSSTKQNNHTQFRARATNPRVVVQLLIRHYSPEFSRSSRSASASAIIHMVFLVAAVLFLDQVLILFELELAKEVLLADILSQHEMRK